MGFSRRTLENSFQVLGRYMYIYTDLVVVCSLQSASSQLCAIRNTLYVRNTARPGLYLPSPPKYNPSTPHRIVIRAVRAVSGQWEGTNGVQAVQPTVKRADDTTSCTEPYLPADHAYHSYPTNTSDRQYTDISSLQSLPHSLRSPPFPS